MAAISDASPQRGAPRTKGAGIARGESAQATDTRQSAMRNGARRSHRLAALTAAAMALPGVHARAADAPVANPFAVDASHLEYSESGNRMNVRVNQATGSIAITDSFQVLGNYIQDVMSGASPIFNAPGAGGQAHQVLTGASVFDRRDAGDIGGTLALGDNQFTLRQGWSLENDYKSNWQSIEARHFANQKNTTFAVGFAFNDDGVSSHDAPRDYRTRIKRDFFAGVTQIINERSLFEVSLEYSYSNGFLSDPYKLAFVQSTGLLPDARPTQRRQFALTGKYLFYVPSIDSSFQIVESLSTDNWGIHAGALEVQWKKELPGEWLVNVGGRLYTQRSADFYQVYFQTPPSNGEHSSDYRMAAFGSAAWLAGVTKQLGPNLSFQFSAERSYRRYSLRSGGTGFDGDNYLWTFYLATLRAEF